MRTNPSHPPANGTPVTSIMTKHFPVVRDTLHLDRLAWFLLSHKVASAAVCDAGGRLIGCVSMVDLVRDRYMNGETEDDATSRSKMRQGFDGALRTGFHVERTQRATVHDIMMPSVLRLPHTASIAQAAALMAFEGVPSVVVVDPSGVVIGVVSALDVLRWLGDPRGHVRQESAKSQWRSSWEYVT